MKILIVGQGRHGKDTMADMLHETYGLSHISSSRFAYEEFAYKSLSFLGYADIEEAYQDRHSIRDLLYNMFSAYNRDEPARLATNIMKNHDIYVGMRCDKELQRCKELVTFDHIVYVDASERVDYVEPASSNKITKEMADVILHNNGTEEEFILEVARWFPSTDKL
jgi:cytidylate kinase